MDDQGIEIRSALGRVDALDGGLVRRVGGEAVDRLGRHGDRLAGKDQAAGLDDCRLAVRGDAGGQRRVWRRHGAAL